MAAVQVPLRQNDFNTGPCECTQDCSSCCDVMFCAVCQVARQYNMVSSGIRDLNCPCCFLMYLLPGFGFLIGAVITRSRAIDRLGITTEGCPVTWLCACCFPGCSTCQVYRELSMRGMWPGGTCCINAPFIHHAFIPPPPVQAMGMPQMVAPGYGQQPVNGYPQQPPVVQGGYGQQPMYGQPQQAVFVQSAQQQVMTGGYVYPQQPQPGYAPQQPQPGYAPQQPQPGYAPQQPQPGYVPQPGYASQQPMYVQQQPAYGQPNQQGDPNKLQL